MAPKISSYNIQKWYKYVMKFICIFEVLYFLNIYKLVLTNFWSRVQNFLNTYNYLGLIRDPRVAFIHKESLHSDSINIKNHTKNYKRLLITSWIISNMFSNWRSQPKLENKVKYSRRMHVLTYLFYKRINPCLLVVRTSIENWSSQIDRQRHSRIRIFVPLI